MIKFLINLFRDKSLLGKINRVLRMKNFEPYSILYADDKIKMSLNNLTHVEHLNTHFEFKDWSVSSLDSLLIEEREIEFFSFFTYNDEIRTDIHEKTKGIIYNFRTVYLKYKDFKPETFIEIKNSLIIQTYIINMESLIDIMLKEK